MRTRTKHDIAAKARELHRKLAGKIEVVSKVRLRDRAALSLAYTPGVAAAAHAIAKTPRAAREMTIKRNSVAIISDGSAVLGLGNIGPEAALPIMEGKAAIFKEFAGVDAFPIVLNTQNTKEIVAAVKAIAPTFGGINLEDIAAPRCFEIERTLMRDLSIPVMHDDQHGTAIVVLAGLINAFRVVHKEIKTSRIVIAGAGAAGTAIAQILGAAGVEDVLVVDRGGIIHKKRKGLPHYKKELAHRTNRVHEAGSLADALHGADAVVGVSGPRTIRATDIRQMSKAPIVFALANPTPEIMPDVALRAGAMVVATGRSDFPNQINNSLAFPGIFRGALDNHVKTITEQHKLDAAHALAALVKRPTKKRIAPDMFDARVTKAVAAALH